MNGGGAGGGVEVLGGGGRQYINSRHWAPPCFPRLSLLLMCLLYWKLYRRTCWESVGKLDKSKGKRAKRAQRTPTCKYEPD